MNKILVLVSVVIVLMAVYVGYSRLFSGGEVVSDDPPSVTTIFPVGESAPSTLVGATALNLPTASGTLSVRNFLSDSDIREDTINPGLYLLAGNSAGGEAGTPNFSIEYIAQTGFFNITLLNVPLVGVRLEAEEALRKRLSLSDEQLCQLHYGVAVPGFVDENASGVDYRFSFCPDTIPL